MAAETAAAGASASAKDDHDTDQGWKDAFAYSFIHSIVMVSFCWVLVFR
jgi:hypothetical protein